MFLIPKYTSSAYKLCESSTKDVNILDPLLLLLNMYFDRVLRDLRNLDFHFVYG